MQLVSPRDITGCWKNCRCFEAEPHNNDIGLGENGKNLNPSDICLYHLSDWMMWFFQGGNNIHEKGVTAIAAVLKDNSVITTVSITFWYVHIGNWWYDTRSPNRFVLVETMDHRSILWSSPKQHTVGTIYTEVEHQTGFLVYTCNLWLGSNVSSDSWSWATIQSDLKGQSHYLKYSSIMGK